MFQITFIHLYTDIHFINTKSFSSGATFLERQRGAYEIGIIFRKDTRQSEIFLTVLLCITRTKFDWNRRQTRDEPRVKIVSESHTLLCARRSHAFLAQRVRRMNA